MNTIIGAFIAALIAMTTAAVALLSVDGVNQLSDISQVQWLIILGGGLITFGKDYQAITTRRLVGSVTGSSDGGGTV